MLQVSAMAVSVPPPLFQLTNVIQFRDDAKPTATSTTPLKSTKNKRKSMEPKKLTSPKNENAFPAKRLKLELDGSDGELTHSPGSSASSSDSHTSERMTSSPQCQMLAPKKRFKQEAMKYFEDAAKETSEKFVATASSTTASNPFRPWDKDVTSPTLKTTLQTTLPSPFLYNPLQTFFPPGFFPPILTPPISTAPTLTPVVRPKTESPETLKSETKRPSPVRDSSDGRSPQFDAETRQVLSRLYPFLVQRDDSFPPEEPEQEEPLALVKRNRSEDDEDVFLKEESDSGKDPFSSSGAAAGKSKQRNYKNMTRERRIEANARERQRVHTITAAFDRLQGVIPTSDDSSGSKLSKLSIIKIATSYIMVLSRMAGLDYSEDQTAPSVEDCIKQCAELVKAESKTRKKSSESD